MCDYSLHLVPRGGQGWRQAGRDGFREIDHPRLPAVGETDVAVCLLPGTELAFEENVQYKRAFSLFGRACVDHKVADSGRST